MNCTVVLDWRLALAFGAAAVGIIFASKISATDAKEVLTLAVGTCKELTVARYGSC